MKSITGIAALSVLILGACSSRDNLPVRHGPQPIHPAEYAQKSAPIAQPTMTTPAVVAPVTPQPTIASRSYERVSPAHSLAPGTTVGATANDTCGAAQYQNLVGGPSSAATSLVNVAKDTRHYGANSLLATDQPSRLNFVHSHTSIAALISPSSTVTRVFCG